MSAIEDRRRSPMAAPTTLGELRTSWEWNSRSVVGRVGVETRLDELSSVRITSCSVVSWTSTITLSRPPRNSQSPLAEEVIGGS
jgi:hypothetical protein